MLKLFVYGCLNRVHSSRRLEREVQRNVELMWLTVMGQRQALAGKRRSGKLTVEWLELAVAFIGEDYKSNYSM